MAWIVYLPLEQTYCNKENKDFLKISATFVSAYFFPTPENP